MKGLLGADMYSQIPNKDIIFGKIVMIEELTSDDGPSSVYKVPRGSKFRTVYVDLINLPLF